MEPIVEAAAFGGLDQTQVNLIVNFCVLAPSAKHNGIARCSRKCNIAWRGMHRKHVRENLEALMEKFEMARYAEASHTLGLKGLLELH